MLKRLLKFMIVSLNFKLQTRVISTGSAILTEVDIMFPFGRYLSTQTI